MARIKNDYFKLSEEQISFTVQASNLLEEIFSDYSIETIPERKNKMHEIEHHADELHHDIQGRLAAEFITPIDQEDILQLVQIIDDITDAIDEVVLDFYMYNITEVSEDAIALSKLVNRCVAALSSAIGELKNFKKPDTLRKLLVEVNSIESEADDVYTEANHKLFTNSSDIKKLLGAKAVTESLESCCDLCEYAAEIIEQIIIKNT